MEKTLEQLYTDYGRLSVQQELLISQINIVKKKIGEALNREAKPEEAKDAKSVKP